MVMQLATKEVQVSLDDEEEGEDDDGDAWMRASVEELVQHGSTRLRLGTLLQRFHPAPRMQFG